MFGSLVLVSLLSTSLVSRLTADRVERNDAASRGELSGKTLAAVTQSSGAEYLDGLHLGYVRCRTLPEALDALVDGRADVVVNSVGALRYFVPRRYASLEVPLGLLAPAYMAVALPQNSPLKRPIDRALIKITSGPEWMGAGRQILRSMTAGRCPSSMNGCTSHISSAEMRLAEV